MSNDLDSLAAAARQSPSAKLSLSRRTPAAHYIVGAVATLLASAVILWAVRRGEPSNRPKALPAIGSRVTAAPRTVPKNGELAIGMTLEEIKESLGSGSGTEITEVLAMSSDGIETRRASNHIIVGNSWIRYTIKMKNGKLDSWISEAIPSRPAYAPSRGGGDYFTPLGR
jgi:hypothetical protein